MSPAIWQSLFKIQLKTKNFYQYEKFLQDPFLNCIDSNLKYYCDHCDMIKFGRFFFFNYWVNEISLLLESSQLLNFWIHISRIEHTVPWLRIRWYPMNQHFYFGPNNLLTSMKINKHQFLNDIFIFVSYKTWCLLADKKIFLQARIFENMAFLIILIRYFFKSLGLKV